MDGTKLTLRQVINLFRKLDISDSMDGIEFDILCQSDDTWMCQYWKMGVTHVTKILLKLKMTL